MSDDAGLIADEKAILDAVDVTLFEEALGRMSRAQLKPLRWILSYLLKRDEAEAERHCVWSADGDSWEDAKERWARPFAELAQAAQNQVLAAHAKDPTGARVLIPPVDWLDMALSQHGRALILSRRSGAEFDVAYRDVHIDAEVVRAHWPPTTQARAKSQRTIKDETNARGLLVRLMRDAPDNPVPKASLRERSEFAHLSGRAFDRAFTAACTEAGAPAWMAAGRRPGVIAAV